MSGESFLLYQSFWIIIEKVFKVFIKYTIDFISIFIQDDRHHNAHCSSWADKPAANQGTAFTTTCRQDHLLDHFANVTTCHQDLLQDFWWLIIPSRISNRGLQSPTTANSTVQDLEQEKIITDIATCYLDPEPELDMTKSESDRHGIQWSSWFGGNRDSEPSSFHTLHSLQNFCNPTDFYYINCPTLIFKNTWGTTYLTRLNITCADFKIKSTWGFTPLYVISVQAIGG